MYYLTNYVMNSSCASIGYEGKLADAELFPPITYYVPLHLRRVTTLSIKKQQRKQNLIQSYVVRHTPRFFNGFSTSTHRMINDISYLQERYNTRQPMASSMDANGDFERSSHVPISLGSLCNEGTLSFL